jgi:hypothetical protein
MCLQVSDRMRIAQNLFSKRKSRFGAVQHGKIALLS